MTGKLLDIITERDSRVPGPPTKVSVSAKERFIIYSPAWGLLGEYWSRDHIRSAMQAGLRAPARAIIAGRQPVRYAVGYKLMTVNGANVWKPILEYRYE